jgi:hypothetical protein
VVKESVDSNKARVVVESDVARKDFRLLVEGHEADGIPLCTPAVYAAIALSLGTYLQNGIIRTARDIIAQKLRT